MRIAFFASHGGSNMQAILDATKSKQLHAMPTLLICNNPTAKAVERAKLFGIPVFVINGKTHSDEGEKDSTMAKILADAEIDIIVLAGYMKKIGPQVLANFSDRILNIHPALLPDFGGKGMYGMRVHNAVIAAGSSESGPTVHLVNERYDEGRILAQKRIAIVDGENPESLAQRVLKEEHNIFWQTLEKIVQGEIVL